MYLLFQVKPSRCTLLLSIFISTSLHVSVNRVPIIRRTYCIYATLVFFTLYGWLPGLQTRQPPVQSEKYSLVVDSVWNVMVHAQKQDFVFRRNGQVHLNRRGRQFNRLLAAEVCASAVVMLDTPCSEVVWRVLATHSVRQFPLHFPSRPSPCAITFQLDCNAHGIFKCRHSWVRFVLESDTVRSMRAFNLNLSVFN